MKMNILLIVIGLLLTSIGIYRLLAVASTRPVGEKQPEISRPFVPDIPTPDAPHEDESTALSEHRISVDLNDDGTPLQFNLPSESATASESSNLESKRPSAPTTRIVDAAKAKGNDFEGYVADILKACGIRIREWNQGTTSPSGAYGENELNPDFKVLQSVSGKTLEYWIECKYRSSIGANGFELDNYQLDRYKKIQGQSRRKIVIALGVGGKAAAPKQFYIIPLDTISRFKHIPDKYLNRYRVTHPETQLHTYMHDWFFNDVFVKDKNKH